MPPPSTVDPVPEGPPYSLKNVTLTGGYFPADYGALEVLCRDIFGAESGHTPADARVFFDLGSVAPADGNGKPWSFLCLRMLTRLPQGEAQAVVTHAFVDRVAAVTVSREVFGFPAIPATFTVPGGGVADVAVLVDQGGTVNVQIEALAPDAKSPSMLSIARVTLPGTVHDVLERHWDWDGPAPQEQTLTIPFSQVIQIRDAVDPRRASFQDVVSGTLTADSGGDAAGSNPVIQLFEYRSFRLASAFGLPVVDLSTASILTTGYRATHVGLVFEIQETERVEPARSGRGGGAFRARSGDPQFAPAYEFHDVELTGFRVPASPAALRKLVDEQLNGPFSDRAYRYAPASHDVIIECLDYGSMLAAYAPPGFQLSDSTSQRELIFRVLVGRVEPGSRVARKPALYCPFLYVDSSWSLLSGREIIGYPKAVATFRHYRVDGELEGCLIQAPDESGNARPILALDCRAHRNGPSIEELLEDGDVGEARPIEPRLRRLREPFQQLWWGLDRLEGALDLDAFIRPWMRGSSVGYGAVQPKCFVSAGDPKSLRYGELLEGDYTIQNMDVELSTHRATLTFDSTDAFGLKQALGVGEYLVVPPESWYRARCDFRLRIFDPLA